PEQTSAVPGTAFRRLAARLGVAAGCLAVAVACQAALLDYLKGGALVEAPQLQRALKDFPRQITTGAKSVPVSLGAWSGTDVLKGAIQPAGLPFFDKADDKLFRPYALPGPGGPLRCQVWMVHFKDGEDRRHHPINCALAAGAREDPEGRDEIPVEG